MARSDNASRSTLSQVPCDLPDGFEISPVDGLVFRVRLRKKLHNDVVLGVTIFERRMGRTVNIEQFDISPTLEGVTHSMAQQMLIEAYQLLGSEHTFHIGRERLGKLESSSLCLRCRLEPVG